MSNKKRVIKRWLIAVLVPVTASASWLLWAAVKDEPAASQSVSSATGAQQGVGSNLGSNSGSNPGSNPGSNQSSSQGSSQGSTPASGANTAADKNSGQKIVGTDAGKPVPVIAVPTKKSDVRVIQAGLGSVVSQGTVLVRSRVNGQLTQVLFKEGQLVKAGQVLAEIDPRPFQAQLAQVQGQALRDQALLKNAKLDLERYKALREQDSISAQQVDAQTSLVQQYEGAVLTDKGLVDNAKLQLSFTKITAPITGRIGLRQIDAGNNIATTDTNGLAVITAEQPINVVFTVPEDTVPRIVKRLRETKKADQPLLVEAWDRGSKNVIAKGRLITIDNQIDQATGTVKLKAQFDNDEAALFPNQFVNIRLLLDTRGDSTTAPNVAIQRGSSGPFVYVVNQDKTVSIRQVKLGPNDGPNIAIETGLEPGELVVISGADKLREGSKVVLGSKEGDKSKGGGSGSSDKPGDGKANEGKPSDGKLIDGKSVENKSTDSKSSDAKSADAKSAANLPGKEGKGAPRDGRAG